MKSMECRVADLRPGEMLSQLQDRAKREVSRNEYGAAVLIECYAEH